MHLKIWLRRATAFGTALTMMQAPAFAQTVVPQPGGPAIARTAMVAHEPALSQAREIALLPFVAS